MFIIACDLGTGGCKASLFDENCQNLGDVFVGYNTIYPASGIHEQKPADWLNAVAQSVRGLLEKTGVQPQGVQALSLSGHSLGCLPIGENGRALQETTPIWSDTRGAAIAERFFENFDEETWYKTTGAGFPPGHYTLFKLLHLRETQPKVFEKMRVFLGTKDYINLCLTGRAATDFSYASGSGAYALEEWNYSDEIIRAAGLPREIFPELLDSSEVVGTLTQASAELLGLPTSVRVVCGGVDNSCMALGAKCYVSGRAYASLGSSSWIAVSSDKPLLDFGFKPYVFTHVVPGQFASAAAVFSSGVTLKWICNQFCQDLLESSRISGENVYAKIMQIASGSPAGSRGLLLNPSLGGGSSLEPSPLIRGAILGLDLSHTRADVLRAALEGIALNLRQAHDALAALVPLEQRLVLVGGGAISPIWRQIYADVFNKTMEKTNVDQDAAALGAAALAMKGLGWWSDFSPVDGVHCLEELCEPVPENAEVYETLYRRFLKTSQMLADWAELDTA
ncbi:MAG: FGGY family carbohydrate kinase [Planctomycetia bacterium]|nr:FGGY family carbohydrate kinase [Planctomycetia bacterium]